MYALYTLHIRHLLPVAFSGTSSTVIKFESDMRRGMMEHDGFVTFTRKLASVVPESDDNMGKNTLKHSETCMPIGTTTVSYVIYVYPYVYSSVKTLSSSVQNRVDEENMRLTSCSETGCRSFSRIMCRPPKHISREVHLPGVSSSLVEPSARALIAPSLKTLPDVRRSAAHPPLLW